MKCYDPPHTCSPLTRTLSSAFDSLGQRLRLGQRRLKLWEKSDEDTSDGCIHRYGHELVDGMKNVLGSMLEFAEERAESGMWRSVKLTTATLDVGW